MWNFLFLFCKELVDNNKDNKYNNKNNNNSKNNNNDSNKNYVSSSELLIIIPRRRLSFQKNRRAIMKGISSRNELGVLSE